MIGGVAGWYRGLTARERTLVAVAGGLALAVLFVFGLVLPIGRAHDAALQRHRDAVEASARLHGQLAALDASGAARPQLAGPVAQVVAASADSAGFVLQSNQPRGNDATMVVVPAARAAAALAWLDTLSEQGIAVESVTMTPAPDGTVAVNAVLRRSTG